MAAIPFGQFSHANLVYTNVVSAAGAGTDYILQKEAAVHCVSVTAETTNIKLPVLATSPFGPAIFFIRWNGLGTLTFAVVAGSTDTISGATSYAEASPVSPVDFIVLALESTYRIIALHQGSASGAVNRVAPNVQVVGNAVDAGHSTAGALHFASTAGTAAPTLGAAAICLGDAAARSHATESVVIGKVSADCAQNAVAIGEHSGAVAASSQAVGESIGLGAGSALVGKATGLIGAGAAVVGGSAAVGAGGCVLGYASGASVAAGEIFLGTGTPSNTAGMITIQGVTGMSFIFIWLYKCMRMRMGNGPRHRAETNPLFVQL